jgi:hypothetical protein
MMFSKDSPMPRPAGSGQSTNSTANSAKSTGWPHQNDLLWMVVSGRRTIGSFVDSRRVADGPVANNPKEKSADYLMSCRFVGDFAFNKSDRVFATRHQCV